jgi:adenylylsulfate kinase
VIRRHRDTNARSIAKALSWRLMGTIATAGLVFIFTRKLVMSLAVGGLEFVSKIGLFWLHERMWDRLSFGKQEPKPSVVWFTGLSGSGKSTISEKVTQTLRESGVHVEHLDGDAVREVFPAGFTRPERHEHLKRCGFLASRMEANGVFVVASFVSPYQESRDAVRRMCKQFIEVYVSTPLEECEKRDVKGLYAKARRGELANFTGISDPYEPPANPELVINTVDVPLNDAVNQVIAAVRVERATRLQRLPSLSPWVVVTARRP